MAHGLRGTVAAAGRLPPITGLQQHSVPFVCQSQPLSLFGHSVDVWRGGALSSLPSL